MTATIAVLLLASAYLVMSIARLRAMPSLSELDQQNPKLSRHSGLAIDTPSAPVRRYKLHVSPELAVAYRQILDLTIESPRMRRVAYALAAAFLVVVAPIRRLVFARFFGSMRKADRVPVKIFERISTKNMDGISQLTNPVVVLKDDALNNTVESRAASLAYGTITLWKAIQAGKIVNWTAGQVCSSDEASFLFTRVSGLHELSTNDRLLDLAETADITPKSYFVVLIHGTAYRVAVPEGELTEAFKIELAKTLRTIVKVHGIRRRTLDSLGTLSMCTHIYDAAQAKIRKNHASYFRTINEALFTLTIVPEATPSTVSELATEHFANPESCWHDKGIQLLVYGNAKASVIGRFRNYVFGSTIMKAVAFAGSEGGKLDFTKLGAESWAKLDRVERPTLDAFELETCRRYRQKHLAWVGRTAHVRTVSTVGKRSLTKVAGTKIQADSVFQSCLQAAYRKVFGHFPIASEAVYMGYFDGIYSASMEFAGTVEIKRFSEKLAQIADRPSDAEQKELEKLLIDATHSHHALTRFARHGFLTPNKAYAWFRSFAFAPIAVGAVIWSSFVPDHIRNRRVFRLLGAAAKRFPVLGRALAFSPVDVASSHLPAMPGTRAAAFQNCRFDQTPICMTPELALPEKLGGMYRPKFLVHYTMHDDYICFSPLCFSAELRERREEYASTLERYLEICGALCADRSAAETK
jgi:hypothetical protein